MAAVTWLRINAGLLGGKVAEPGICLSPASGETDRADDVRTEAV